MQKLQNIANQLVATIMHLQAGEQTTFNRLIEQFQAAHPELPPIAFQERIYLFNFINEYLEKSDLYLDYAPYLPQAQSEYFVASFSLGKATHLTFPEYEYHEDIALGQRENNIREIILFRNRAIFRESVDLRTAIRPSEFAHFYAQVPQNVSTEQHDTLLAIAEKIKANAGIDDDDNQSISEELHDHVTVTINQQTYDAIRDSEPYEKLLQLFADATSNTHFDEHITQIAYSIQGLKYDPCQQQIQQLQAKQASCLERYSLVDSTSDGSTPEQQSAKHAHDGDVTDKFNDNAPETMDNATNSIPRENDNSAADYDEKTPVYDSTINFYRYYSNAHDFTGVKAEVENDKFIAISKEDPILIIPRGNYITVDHGKYLFNNSDPIFVFEGGHLKSFNTSIDRKSLFDQVTTPEALMEFMNNYIIYGWIDNDNAPHLHNLRTFRKNYKINSSEQVLQSGLATCIEQTKLAKDFFDKCQVESKIFCHRGFENDDCPDKKINMHCFIVFKTPDDDHSWVYFEHSDRSRRGMTRFVSIGDAVEAATKGLKPNDQRILTEIPDIPAGLSFKDFNLYVNGFDKS